MENLTTFLEAINLQQILASFKFWFNSTILVMDNLIQGIVLIVAIMIGLFLGPRIRKTIKITESYRAKHAIIYPLITRTLALSTHILILVLLWFIVLMTETIVQYQSQFIMLFASLLTAWVVIRFLSGIIQNQFLARLVSWVTWILAILIAFDKLQPVTTILDDIAISFGQVHISVLSVFKGIILLGILLWTVLAISNRIENLIVRSASLTPSAKVLISKLAKIGLITLAVLIVINSFGIDLTALAVFGGALGIGIGLGLQTVVSNLVSGILLLLDKSIKPNDVITVGQTFGWVEKLGVRFTSVRTRDGIEHIIPNEELISQRVESWSHSDQSVRLRIPIGISYSSDVRLAMEICVAEAAKVERVKSDPAPRCLFRAFGESSLNLEIRVWIDDMTLGRGSVISEILLRVWDEFRKQGIQLPYPQRDLHVKSIDTSVMSQIQNLKG